MASVVSLFFFVTVVTQLIFTKLGGTGKVARRRASRL